MFDKSATGKYLPESHPISIKIENKFPKLKLPVPQSLEAKVMKQRDRLFEATLSLVFPFSTGIKQTMSKITGKVCSA